MGKTAAAERVIKLPDGVSASLSGSVLTVKGPKAAQTRDFTVPGITLAVDGKAVKVRSEFPRRREKAIVGTYEAHIKNMVKGASKDYEYTLKTVFSHFPIKTKVEGNTCLIENFLGERHPRSAAILPDTKVTVKGEMLTVTGPNKEHVGQTAANIERATKVKKRDVRVFQDGIYIVSKGA